MVLLQLSHDAIWINLSCQLKRLVSAGSIIITPRLVQTSSRILVCLVLGAILVHIDTQGQFLLIRDASGLKNELNA